MPELRDGVSIICAVCNRTEPLRYAIPSWLNMPNLNQVVIVDWSSEIDLFKSLGGMDIPRLDDPRIVRISAPAQVHFSLPKSFNLASMFVHSKLMLKLDADVVIVDGRSIPRPTVGRSFVSGNWQKAVERGPYHRNESYLTGSCFVGLKDFKAVGGYDERFNRYGYDDDDLYHRLERSGLSRQTFPDYVLHHLHHSESSRLGQYEVDGNDWKVNRDLSTNRELWSRESDSTSYKIEKIRRNRFTAIERNSK